MIEFFIALLVGGLVGSLGEYWVHRGMHRGMLYGAAHFAHHSLNHPQGWLREYWAYVQASGLWLFAVAIGAYVFAGIAPTMGWLVGTFGFLALSAYTHMLYHVDPNLVFWVKRPIHYFHHGEAQSSHNFGVTTDVWDRLFKTYKDDPSWQPQPVSRRKVLSIPWL